MNCDLCARYGWQSTAVFEVKMPSGRNMPICQDHRNMVLEIYGTTIKRLEVENAQPYNNNQD